MTKARRDRYETSSASGVRAIAEGVRIVKPPGVVKIAGRLYTDWHGRLAGDPETYRQLFTIQPVKTVG